jgi:LysM repeat protein
MHLGRKVKSLQLALILTLLAGILLGILTACSPSAGITRETDERAYRRGKSLLREGRKEEALQAFLSLVSARPDASESHLEAGLIYLNHIKDPLAAIYHFRNYLAMNPEGDHVELVKELILTAQKDFAKSLPGEPFGNEVDRVNLMETVKDLQAESNEQKQKILQLQKDLVERESLILTYQAQLNVLQGRPAESGNVAPIIIQQPTAANQPTQPAPDTYTVEAGDTLSRISTKVYGTSSRWMDIFQANQEQLTSPNALKPGQVLRLP